MPFFDPEVMGPAFDDLLGQTDAILQGRRTYRVMAGAWPDRAGDPFADRLNSLPKYVVSDSLTEADATWAPTTIIRGADLVSRWRRCASRRAATSTSRAARRWPGPCSPTTSSTTCCS